MFGLGMTEMIVIGAIALLVVGPKDLPKVFKGIASLMKQVRKLTREFQGVVSDMIRESDLDDLRKEASDLRKLSMISLKRLILISCGTSSCSLRAAIVFPRSEYANIYAWSYPTRRMRSTVSAWSSSVSPQNPAMKSDDKATPGRVARIESTSSR